jgi:hypothetical protein
MGSKYDDKGFLKPDELLIEDLTKLVAETCPLTVLDGLVATCEQLLADEVGKARELAVPYGDEPAFRLLIADLAGASARAKDRHLKDG